MEYLVTMTTVVPDGTPTSAVEDIRRREAMRSRELVMSSNLLRLWRPPVRPGEWRTLGLFSADDASELERVLASMPLRVWRSDEVVPLVPHPNDPVDSVDDPAIGPEFLTTFTVQIPDGTPAHRVDGLRHEESVRTYELAAARNLVRLWSLPGDRAVGLWRARDRAQMDAIVESLPMASWLSTDTVALAEHPNDPALAERASRTG